MRNSFLVFLITLNVIAFVWLYYATRFPPSGDETGGLEVDDAVGKDRGVSKVICEVFWWNFISDDGYALVLFL